MLLPRYLFALFITLTCIPAFAQKNNPREIDSLTGILTGKIADTARVMTLKRLSIKYHLSNPDTSLQLCEEALALAEKINWPKGIAASRNGIGLAHYRKGNYVIAMGWQKAALQLYDSLKDENGIAHIHSDMALVSSKTGDYPEALKDYFESLRIERLLGDSGAVAKVLGNLAIVYGDMQEYDNALRYHFQSIKIYQSLGYDNEIARAYGNVGVIYSNRGLALMGDTAQAGHRDSLFQLSNYYYVLSLQVARRANDLVLVGRQYSNIAINYYCLGRQDSTFYYFDEALKLFGLTGDQTGKANTLGNIANVYFDLGDYTNAEKYFQESLTLATAAKDASDRKFALSMLHKVYAAMGNFESAYEYHKLYTRYKDSLSNESKSKEIGRLEAKAEYVQKEAIAEAEHQRELAVAEEKEKQQLIISIAVGTGLVLVIIFALFLYSRFRVIRSQKVIIEAEKKKSEELLLNILPEKTAQELKEKGHSDARLIDEATVLFTDFKGFTLLSEQLSPQELVGEINECFSAFDRIIGKHNIEKIKTIGDAYMAAGGLPVPNSTHAKDVVSAALEIRNYMQELAARKASENKPFFEIRIGVHTGPVVAGIVGIKKFQYDIWGDTVNTASRMESSGEAGHVNISATTYNLVKDNFACTPRGKIAAKNKGELEMFFAEMK